MYFQEEIIGQYDYKYLYRANLLLTENYKLYVSQLIRFVIT